MPCLEEGDFIRLWVGWVDCGGLGLDSSSGLGEFRREGVSGLGF